MKKVSSIYRLSPIINEDMLHVCGRLSNSHLDKDLMHRVILPRNDPVALFDRVTKG